MNLTTKGTGIKQVKVFGKEFEKKTVFKRVCRSRFACAERLPPSKSRAFIFEKLDKYGRSYILLLEDEKYSEVFMLATLPLKEMSLEEKFMTLETVWDDIVHNSPDFPSPSWHREVL